MTRNKKVSVIVPVYNNEKYIAKCIRSLLDQTYREIEVIAVDDGSCDDSGIVLNQVAQEDARLVVVHQENKGVSNARNHGLGLATGDYVTFVDGDDYVGASYIERLVECALQNHAEMVVSGLTFVDEDGNVSKEIIPGQYIRGEHEEWLFRISAVACHLYERRLWEEYQVRFFEGERGEDMPISLFFASVCKNIVTLQEKEYYYVQHGQSAMHNFRGLKNMRLPYQALEETIRKIMDIGICNDQEFHELFVYRILSTCISLARGASKQEIDKLSDYIVRITKDYYPDIYHNSKIGVFSDLDIPLFQKASVRLLVLMLRMGCLRSFLRIVCR